MALLSPCRGLWLGEGRTLDFDESPGSHPGLIEGRVTASPAGASVRRHFCNLVGKHFPGGCVGNNFLIPPSRAYFGVTKQTFISSLPHSSVKHCGSLGSFTKFWWKITLKTNKSRPEADFFFPHWGAAALTGSALISVSHQSLFSCRDSPCISHLSNPH